MSDENRQNRELDASLRRAGLRPWLGPKVKDPMLCARTVCQNKARCKHSQTGKLYCLSCAKTINRDGGVPNLIEVPSRDVVAELRHLTDPKRLKTDEQAATERERIKKICLLYDVQYPEDVFDRYA